MFRPSERQRDLFSADNLYLDQIGRHTFYAFLALEGDRLFPDEAFAQWFCPDNGRPCTSPCLLTKVLLLQMHDRCSDEEAVDRARWDARWAAALGTRIGERSFAKSTLQLHRARIHLSEMGQRLLDISVQEARRAGILKSKKIKVALDTTPVFGRGALKDTYNLVADGIKAVAGELARASGERPQEWAARHDLSRYWRGSVKGQADIDWSQEKERRAFLGALVADVNRVLVFADRALAQMSPEDPQARAIRQASDLLRQLVEQDVDRSAQEPRLKEGVARDRVLSVTDPEMRHGHKSASRRFDGYKLALAVEPVSQIITALKTLPANAPDSRDALDLVKASENTTGAPVEKAIGDCAYGDGATRCAFARENRTLVAKLPSPPRDEPCHKACFHIDLVNGRVTCPAGHTTTDFDYVTPRKAAGAIGPRPAVKRFRFPAELCGACPLASRCLQEKNKQGGRVVTLHPQEHLLQEARAYQKTEAFRQDQLDRQTVEHRIARLCQLGIRQSRYFGRAKTELQCVLTAVVANLTRILGVLSRQAQSSMAAANRLLTLFLQALLRILCPDHPVWFLPSLRGPSLSLIGR